MNKSKIVEIFKWRKTLVQNYESIKNAVKSSQEADLSSQGQLDFFSAGLKVEKTRELVAYEGSVDLMDMVNTEVELMGLPLTYEPLNAPGIDMYIDLYCTHAVHEMLDLNEKTTKIIILDRIVNIEYKISQKGNKYVKLFLSQTGATYINLWGSEFRDLINRVFVGSTYLISLDFNTPTPEFDRYSYVCKYLQNVKDVDIDTEYKRLCNSCKVEVMDREWIETNKKEWL